jgi:hypothetical protein
MVKVPYSQVKAGAVKTLSGSTGSIAMKITVIQISEFSELALFEGPIIF